MHEVSNSWQDSVSQVDDNRRTSSTVTTT